jgi:alpha-tubulin suppressor-like RCC1 family protein
MPAKETKAKTGEVFCWGAGSTNKIDRLLFAQQRHQSCPLDIHKCYFACLKSHQRFFEEAHWPPNEVSGKSYNLPGGNQIKPVDPALDCTTILDATGVSAGELHSLAILPGGRVTGWGANDKEQVIDRAGTILKLSDIVQVAAGGEHSLALRTDGTVVGWGAGNPKDFAVEPPKGVSDVVQIAAGQTHSIALKKNGDVVGWGTKVGVMGYDFQQASPPKTLKSIQRIGATSYGSWAIDQDGKIFTWGSFNEHTTPPKGLKGVRSLAFGMYHGMALLENGTITCWGKGQNGKTDLGFKQREEYAQATPPKGLRNVVQISAGAYHSMALDPDGKVFCWGAGSDGREGKDEKKQITFEFKQATPPNGLPKIKEISAGRIHSVAVSA